MIDNPINKSFKTVAKLGLMPLEQYQTQDLNERDLSVESFEQA